jgi:hypothetical protein
MLQKIGCDAAAARIRHDLRLIVGTALLQRRAVSRRDTTLYVLSTDQLFCVKSRPI